MMAMDVPNSNSSLKQQLEEGDEDKKRKTRKISGFEESEGAWEDKVEPLLSRMKEMHHLFRKNGESALDPLNNKLNLVFVCSYACHEFDPHEHGPVFSPAFHSACLDLYTYQDDFELVLVTKVLSTTPFEDPSAFCDYVMPFPFPLPSLVVPYEDSESRAFMCDLVLGPPPDPEEFKRGQGYDFKCLLVNIAEKTLFVGQPGSMSSFVGHLQELLSSSSFDAQRSYHRLCKTMWPLVSCHELTPPYYPPFFRIFENVKPEYPDAAFNYSGLRPIQIGQKLDVKLLLCADGRGSSNELLLRNNGEQVELGKAIEGKYTMICCFHAPVFGTDSNSIVVQSLVTTCSELYAQGMNFEMVVVVKMKKLADYKQVFDHFLSGFPSSCLVIPFEDSKLRDFICNYLQLSDDVQCLLLDNNNNILLHGYPEFARSYGADAFPFLDEKLQALEADEGPAWATCSANKDLVSLLRCKPSDVLKKTSNAEEDQDGCDDSIMTRTIADLVKNDVVGLYLCTRGDAIPKIKKVNEQCKIQQKPFEVLLVYIPFYTCLDPHKHKLCVDNLLQKHELSLWYMPFDNSVSHKLSRLSGFESDDQLFIFFRDQQGALSIDRCGRKIISDCGIGAYPFIRNQLVARELERVTNLTLETLLVHKARTYVLQNNEQIPVADLKGQNIFVFFKSLSDNDLPELEKLSYWYADMKEKNNSGFEVVFILKHKSNVAGEDPEDSVMSVKMPWLVCPFDADHSAFVKEKIYPNFFVEFGEDGQLRSLRADRILDSYWLGCGTIPFGSKDLRGQVIENICLCYGADIELMTTYSEDVYG